MTVPTSTTATRGNALPGGIYCPSISFFKPTAAQELDMDTYTKHMEFLAKAGVHGVVVLGSTAEAVALTRDERKQVGPAFSSRLGPERIFFLLVTKTNLC
jgi:4-hydroxy-2-oxoglutarate aldolase